MLGDGQLGNRKVQSTSQDGRREKLQSLLRVMPAVHSLHEHFRQSATRLSGDVAQHRMGQQTAVMLGWQLPRIATAL